MQEGDWDQGGSIRLWICQKCYLRSLWKCIVYQCPCHCLSFNRNIHPLQIPVITAWRFEVADVWDDENTEQCLPTVHKHSKVNCLQTLFTVNVCRWVQALMWLEKLSTIKLKFLSAVRHTICFGLTFVETFSGCILNVSFRWVLSPLSVWVFCEHLCMWVQLLVWF